MNLEKFAEFGEFGEFQITKPLKQGMEFNIGYHEKLNNCISTSYTIFH